MRVEKGITIYFDVKLPTLEEIGRRAKKASAESFLSGTLSLQLRSKRIYYNNVCNAAVSKKLESELYRAQKGKTHSNGTQWGFFPQLRPEFTVDVLRV